MLFFVSAPGCRDVVHAGGIGTSATHFMPSKKKAKKQEIKMPSLTSVHNG